MRIFLTLVFASAITLGATGCTGPLDDVFDDQIAIAARLGERLTDSGLEGGNETGDRENWGRDLQGAHHRVTLLFVEEGP